MVTNNPNIHDAGLRQQEEIKFLGRMQFLRPFVPPRLPRSNDVSTAEGHLSWLVTKPFALEDLALVFPNSPSNSHLLESLM
ncbi:hypothetical protein E4U21_004495 [Claviceps maximensis]|nr:hypothetical protein E4U21_004495 [Claviceps maximensis]